MFVIQIADVTDILHKFSCEDIVLEIEMLAYYQELDKTCIIIYSQTSSCKKYVLKLISAGATDISLEESRSSFSEFLRENGVPAPRKYMSNGKYFIEKSIGGIVFLISVEDYFGIDVKEITSKSSFELGRLLGIMHKISLDSDYHLEYGTAYSALKSGKVEFYNIWEEYEDTIFEQSYLEKIRKLHDCRMRSLTDIWQTLPIASVHGDLGLTSNLVFYNNYYGIIDFNLSGDEPLLGDLLITWYSSRYSDSFIHKVSFDSVDIIKKSFFEGYFSMRELTSFEKENFEQISKSLNGVYFNKLVSRMIRSGEREIGIKLSKSIYENYFVKDTTLDLGAELGIYEPGLI